MFDQLKKPLITSGCQCEEQSDVEMRKVPGAIFRRSLNNIGFYFAVILFFFFCQPALFAQITNIQPRNPSVREESTSSEQDTQNFAEEELDSIKEEAQTARTEKEKAKNELRLQQREIDLQKKEAEIKRREALLAKKEAELIEKNAQNEAEIQQALDRAAQKDKEAKLAQKKVALAEDKMQAVQDKITISEQRLALARQRADLAEKQIDKKRSVFYRKILQTLAIVFFGYLLLFIAINIINNRIENIRLKHLARKNILYVLNFFIFLSILFLWVQNLNSITIFFSILSAGLALALQEVILSIAGWIYMLVRRPFEIGDRIELGGIKGDVIDIRFFQTTLLEIGNWVEADQSTGRIVNVPNSFIFKKENYNYSHGFEFIWNEIKIIVTFESDWKRAEEIMLDHSIKEAKEQEKIVKKKIKNMTKRYMIYYEKLTPIVYTSIQDSGVCLTLRYLTDARGRRSTQDTLCRAVLDDFAKEPNVNFAYPTYRIVQQ